MRSLHVRPGARPGTGQPTPAATALTPPRPVRAVARAAGEPDRAQASPSSPAQPTSVPALKQALLRAAAPTNRGKAADRAARLTVLDAVVALETAAPAKDAALDAAGLSGEWGLLYSGPGDRAEAAAADTAAYEKRTGGLEGPVIAALRPLGRWVVSSTGTRQVIDAGAGSVHNVASFRLAGGLAGELDVEGAVAPAPPGEVTPAVGATCGRARTDVSFTALTLRLGGRRLLSLPLTAFKPCGWIETTVLLDGGDLRVSRGDKGSVFVAAKRKDK